MGLRIDLSDLFVPGHAFELGGRRLTSLPAPHQLLHAAYASVVGDWPPRLSAQRDVAQVLLTLDPAPDEVLDLARRWQARALLATALHESWETLTPEPRPVLVEWAQSYRPGTLERLLLASQQGPARAYTRHVAALLVARGLRARGAYLRAIVWPDRSYLEARRLSRGRFAARAIRGLRPRG